MVELRLLPDPENSQSNEAHQVHQEAWRESYQGVPQIELAVYRLHRGYAKVEHQQRHADREHSITQRRQPLAILIGNLVVKRRHAASVLKAGCRE